jgi:outer membrane protein assembly factor BamB
MYTTGTIGDDTVITALDLDGKMLWQAKNGRAWTGAYPGSRSTPTIDGDFIYHESPHGDLVCLNAETGKKIWGLNILERFRSKNIIWALSESLLIDGDHVICSPGGPEVSMVALDKRTGEVAWTTPSTGESAGYASAMLFEQGGLRIISTMTAQAIIGVNADTGALLWRVKHGSDTFMNAQTPLYRDEHLFVSTLKWGATKWKVHTDGRQASLEEIWMNEDFGNRHGGAVFAEGNIYGTSGTRNRNSWVCLDWETSEIEGMAIDVQGGSILYADGLLYMLGTNGELGLLRPTESGSELISLFNIPDSGEGETWAHPVIAGGNLFIRHDTYLYRYDISAD